MENKYKELYGRYCKEQDEYLDWLKEQPLHTILQQAPIAEARDDIIFAIDCIITDDESADSVIPTLIDEHYSLADLAEIVVNRLYRDTMPTVYEAIFDETNRNWLSK